MTIQELIDKLNMIENKDVPVLVTNENGSLIEAQWVEEGGTEIIIY